MARLSAEENRYLLFAGYEERAKVRRIPGCRWDERRRRWALPHQAGVVLALDRVFGREGWEHDPGVLMDVEEARGREYPPAMAPAHVRLERGQLAVTCNPNDRELVKRVPGYRWDPNATPKSWYVPALPLAFDLLAEGFAEKLEVDPEVRTYIELKRDDEARAEEQAAAGPPHAPASSAPVEQPAPPEDQPLRDERDGTGSPPTALFERLLTQLELLTAAIERLDARLEAGGGPVGALPPTEPAEQPAEDAGGGIESVLRLLDEDPEAAAGQASRSLQAAGGEWPDMRALAGLALARAGQADQAFEQLSRALSPRRTVADAGIAGAARDEYGKIILRFLNTDLGPAEPLEKAEDLLSLLLRELQSGGAFDTEALGASGLRTLTQLLREEAVAAAQPELANACRVAHLVASARAGARGARGQVVEALQSGGLPAEGQALALILLANLLSDRETMDEWYGGWPRDAGELGLDDAGWVADRALQVSPLVARELAWPAALAALAIVAPAPSEAVTLQQRRELVKAASARNRRYAQFLALYAVALSGEKANVEQFPGYLEVLAEKSLEQSAGYLEDVYYAGPRDLLPEIAERAYVPALLSRGVRSVRREVMDLLDLVRMSPKADNLLNEVGKAVEEEEVPGADRFSAAERVALYRAALNAAIERGHDRDAEQAFWRLVREYQMEPGSGALRELCAECLAVRQLRASALICQLEMLLEEGAEHAEALANVLDAVKSDKGRQKRKQGTHAEKGPEEQDEPSALELALRGLQLAYPELRAQISAALEASGVEPELAEEPQMPGKRVLLIGGRPAVCKRVEATLRHWKLDVDWLDAGAAKQGGKAPAAAEGAADLVVINTAYIGHAASGRVKAAAEAAGKTPLMNDADGVGSMLARVWEALKALGAGEGAGGAPKRGKVKGLRERAGL